MQPTKEEKIQYCAKFGTFWNMTIRLDKIDLKCDNCEKNISTACLKSNSCALCLTCVETLNRPTYDDAFDYLSGMAEKKDLHISSKHIPPKFNGRMMCDFH